MRFDYIYCINYTKTYTVQNTHTTVVPKIVVKDKRDSVGHHASSELSVCMWL